MEEKDNHTQENENEKQKTGSANGEKQKMVIEISKYKRIVETFNQPSTLAKLVIVSALLILLVFAGISILALVMKSYYPYKVVNANEYGATIIQNEDNEVIYWLLNSADLWANSGIEVHKGDVISVHTSGAFHSSIHHLVDDAKANRMKYNWINPTGGKPSENLRDDARGKYRITKEYPFNTLLMQVIPEDIRLKNEYGQFKKDDTLLSYLDGQPKSINNSPDIYVIGGGKDKITIRTNGILHFAVNDIVLTKRVIDSMKNGDRMALNMGEFPIPKYSKDVVKLFLALSDNEGKYISPNATAKFSDNIYRYFHNKLWEAIKKDEKLWKDYKKGKDSVSYLRDLKNSSPLGDMYDELIKFIKTTFTELDYYYITNFVDAWYVDNVGSFLIVIERKKQK